MKIYLAKISEKKKYRQQIIQNEIQNNGIEEIIRPTLFKLKTLGYTYKSHSKLIKSTVAYTLDYVATNYPVHVVWQPVNSGVRSGNSKVEDLDRGLNLTRIEYIRPFSELKYGSENALLNWNGRNWSISSLGELFMSLSLPTGTVLLLLIENYFSSTDADSPFNHNPWHITRKFLEALSTEDSICVDIGDGRYTLMEHDPNMRYLNRIDDFQLTHTIDRTLEHRGDETHINGIPIFHIADDFFETTLTEFGKEVIGQVIKSEGSILTHLIQNLILFELSGSKYLDFKNDKVLAELTYLSKKHKSIVGEQKQAIKDFSEAIQTGHETIVTLRAIPPTIEKICKNILIESGILNKGDTTSTLGMIIAEYKKLLKTKPILQEETIEYIDNIARNKFLHGNLNPTDEIKTAYLNLMLNVLVKILEDYGSYKDK